MSSYPVIIVDGEFKEALENNDWKTYLNEHYPGVEFRWENGYQLNITSLKRTKEVTLESNPWLKKGTEIYNKVFTDEEKAERDKAYRLWKWCNGLGDRPNQ